MTAYSVTMTVWRNVMLTNRMTVTFVVCHNLIAQYFALVFVCSSLLSNDVYGDAINNAIMLLLTTEQTKQQHSNRTNMAYCHFFDNARIANDNQVTMACAIMAVM